MKDEMGEPGGRQHKSGQQNAYKEVKAARPHNVTHVTERENKALWHTHLTARANKASLQTRLQLARFPFHANTGFKKYALV